MENVKITSKKITWEETKKKLESTIVYKTTILNHGDHISISKVMFVDGIIKRDELTHIPNELLPMIVKWIGF